MSLWPWQEEGLAAALASNVIIQIPTGGGKTLIACRAIDHFRREHDADDAMGAGSARPPRRAMFVVPTRALVEQQAAYCESHCAPRPLGENISAGRLSGIALDGWSQQDWAAALGRHEVLVGTPEVFKNALLKNAIVVASLSLIVFDECHNAVGIVI